MVGRARFIGREGIHPKNMFFKDFSLNHLLISKFYFKRLGAGCTGIFRQIPNMKRRIFRPRYPASKFKYKKSPARYTRYSYLARSAAESTMPSLLRSDRLGNHYRYLARSAGESTMPSLLRSDRLGNHYRFLARSAGESTMLSS